jgi:hypothetical protein
MEILAGKITKACQLVEVLSLDKQRAHLTTTTTAISRQNRMILVLKKVILFVINQKSNSLE